MFHNIELQEGAFVISDAHYSHFRPQLLDFLKAIEVKQYNPTQLILLGDIFDTLFGGLPQTQEINQEAIRIINKLSLEIEVIYLEGNHDFNLTKIFPHAKVIPLQNQPVACGFNEKKIYLAHGDINTNLSYKFYAKTIRSPFVMQFLRFLNFVTNNFIIGKLDDYLSKKNDCREFVGFEKFILSRLEGKYNCDFYIEGHYHQNKSFLCKDFKYINLGAFACNQRFFIVKSSTELELLEENNFSKGR